MTLTRFRGPAPMVPIDDLTDRVEMSIVISHQRSVSRARHLAESTPPDRNRAVDLLRAFSILAVVFGHWLMAAPEITEAGVRVGHLIGEHRWAQWATWLLQVMPIFFFVGGYSNSVGWRSAVRRGTGYGEWLTDRLRRLTYPLLPLLAVWVPAAWLGWRSGLDPDLIRLGSQAALVPVWFLATYVLIVMLVPVTLRMWERHGWATVAGFTALAGAVDIASLGFGVPLVRWLNYVFVWNAVHALGYAWADGRLAASIRSRLAMAGVGVTALGALVAVGPYPLAMVGLDGAAVTNSNPPKVTLVALGLFQFGLAMAAEPALRRRLSDVRTWTGVVMVNASIMSLYLWHLTVMVAVLGASIALDGLGLGIETGSALWWSTRPIWLIVLALPTMGVMALVARFERPRPRSGHVSSWRPLVGVAGLCAGLGLLARFGVADADGLNSLAIAATVMGLAIGGVLGRPARRTA